MLDNRPIIQKSLIGSAAFAAVFFAAMAASAFMITGGFGHWDSAAPSSTASQPISQPIPVVRVNWAPTPQASPDAARSFVSDEADGQDASFGSDAYAEGDLEGAGNAEVMQVSARAPDEAQIMQDFATDYAALYEVNSEANARGEKKQAQETDAY